MIRYNYHTHTTRCKHAAGSDADYVKAALEGNFACLGFSDHCPWPYKSDFVATCRMPLAQMPDYLTSIRGLREKYRTQLPIYLGFECEYFPEYLSWLKEMREREQLDYLILGNHFDGSDETGMYFGNAITPKEFARYVDMTIKGLETGLFSYLAHPELAFRNMPAFTAECIAPARALIRAVNALHLPLEYNLQGVLYLSERKNAGQLGYPIADFWRLAAEENATAIIGVDAHKPQRLSRPTDYDDAQRFLTSLALPITHEIRMFDNGNASVPTGGKITMR